MEVPPGFFSHSSSFNTLTLAPFKKQAEPDLKEELPSCRSLLVHSFSFEDNRPTMRQMQSGMETDDAPQIDISDIYQRTPKYLEIRLANEPHSIPKELPPVSFTTVTSFDVLAYRMKFLFSGKFFTIFSSNKSFDTNLALYSLDDLSINKVTVFKNKALLIACNDRYSAIVYANNNYITVYQNVSDLKDVFNQEISIPLIEPYNQNDIFSICLLDKKLWVSFKKGPILIHDLESTTRGIFGQFDMLKFFSTDGSSGSTPCVVGVDTAKGDTHVWKKHPENDQQFIHQNFQLTHSKTITAVTFDKDGFFFGDPRGNVFKFEGNEFKIIYDAFKTDIVGIAILSKGLLVASKKEVHFLKKIEEKQDSKFIFASYLPIAMGSTRSITAMKKIGDDRVAIGISIGRVSIFKLDPQ